MFDEHNWVPCEQEAVCLIMNKEPPEEILTIEDTFQYRLNEDNENYLKNWYTEMNMICMS